MGLRKSVLEAITTAINGLVVGNYTITVKNTLFEGSSIARDFLPQFAIVPAVEQINILLPGRPMDSVLRIAMFGYSSYSPSDGETLFGVAEDIIEGIIQALTSQSNVDNFNNVVNFAITEMGPIICEQMDEAGSVAYISIPIATVIVEN